LSDIFKKIRSIEAEDDAITEALGLKSRTSVEPDQSAKGKPLNLSIPDEDDILDLDHLSLDEADMSYDADDIDIDTELVDVPKSSTRLGLTPILPLSKPAEAVKPAADPIVVKPTTAPPMATPPRPAPAPASQPLPDFMDNRPPPPLEPENLSKESAESNVSRNEKSVLEKTSSEKHTDYSKPRTGEDMSSKGRTIAIVGALAAFIWIVCAGLLLADILGGTGTWASMGAVQKLGFALMALLPLVLIGLATYAFAHLNKVTSASHELMTTAESLMSPDDTVIVRSTIMAKSIQAQVDEVNLKVSSALTRMELLDDMLKSQGSSLAKSTLAIDNTTSDVEHRITSQREGLDTIAKLFEDRMDALSAMMESHSAQLASSGHMAEQRVQEARVSVEGAAEKIASASEIVRHNAVAAAQTLSGSQLEIAKLGTEVQTQSTHLDAVYRKHLNDLKVMLTDLREQQDELGATMEERLSKMRDMSVSATVGAQSLTEASIKGRETVEALNEAASLTDTAVRARFSEMEDMVKYSTARAESISEKATRQVQNSLSTTRKEIARIESDMMDLMDKLSQAESAKATQVFDTPAPALRGIQEADEGPKQNETPPDIHRETSLETSLFNLRRPPEEAAPPHPNDNRDLEVIPPLEQDLPNDMRRPTGETDEKDRSKWSLRGLFSASDDAAQSASNHYGAEDVSDSHIIEVLTGLGLTPAAIVDDGCIIEASNLRKVKGHAAMSEAVVKRLGEPVRHLFKSAEMDADLKSKLRAFTAQFEARLSPNEGDREAIRTRLESDSGRAYLLCDAALNG